MRFAFWYYTGKFGFALFPALLAALLINHGSAHSETVASAIIGVIVVLSVTGAIMGGLLALGRLRMRCPFCGEPGPVGGSRSRGMWMECGNCGVVHGSGLWGLRLVAEPPDGSAAASAAEGERRVGE